MQSLSKTFSRWTLLTFCAATVVVTASAKTWNGNELALYVTEATTDAARNELISVALGQQHFFRYLRVVTLREGETNGCPFVFLSMNEPSSRFTVECAVMKTISLAKLKEDPVTKVGDAVALTGVVAGVDVKRKLITLGPVIVRYKDLHAPKAGKELLAERDSSSVVYSFTGGKNPVNVTLRDKDLLAREKEILATKGKDAWALFLLTEIAKRDKVAREERNKLDIYRHIPAPTATGAATNAPPPITKDDD
jgi:hypothetical protein